MFLFLSVLQLSFFLISSKHHNSQSQLKSIPVCKPEPCDCDTPGTINCDDQNLHTVAIDPLVDPRTITVVSMISNGITELKSEQILLGQGKQLNQLFLSNNGIEVIEDGAFECTPVLEFMDLSNNRLNTLTDRTFNGLSSLITLRLDHNKIEDLSQSGPVLSTLPKLRYLSIDWTPVNSVSNETFSGLDSLVELSIDHGELSTFPINTFKGLSRLETLSLRHNRFHVLPVEELRWLSQLKHVDFSGNPILTVNSNSFRHNTYLRTISLVNMPELSYVEDCAFCNVYDLRTLTIINSTKFVDFDPDAFGRDTIYFRSIETVDLVNNSLSTLDEDMLPWENVTGLIRLAGNPWKCDCNVLWMINKGLKYDQAQPPVCASPSALKGKSIPALHDYDPGFCLFTRLNARIRSARLFMVIAVLIVVFIALSTSWYLLANRGRNCFKIRNFFYKPQLPKYAYRNLAMSEDAEPYPPVTTSDTGSILPKNGKEGKRDLVVSLAEDI